MTRHKVYDDRSSGWGISIRASYVINIIILLFIIMILSWHMAWHYTWGGALAMPMRDTSKPGPWTLDWTMDWTVDWSTDDLYPFSVAFLDV